MEFPVMLSTTCPDCLAFCEHRETRGPLGPIAIRNTVTDLTVRLIGGLLLLVTGTAHLLFTWFGWSPPVHGVAATISFTTGIPLIFQTLVSASAWYAGEYKPRNLIGFSAVMFVSKDDDHHNHLQKPENVPPVLIHYHIKGHRTYGSIERHGVPERHSEYSNVSTEPYKSGDWNWDKVTWISGECELSSVRHDTVLDFLRHYSAVHIAKSEHQRLLTELAALEVLTSKRDPLGNGQCGRGQYLNRRLSSLINESRDPDLVRARGEEWAQELIECELRRRSFYRGAVSTEH